MSWTTSLWKMPAAVEEEMVVVDEALVVEAGSLVPKACSVVADAGSVMLGREAAEGWLPHAIATKPTATTKERAASATRQ
jgi:hypothetical protein